MRTSLLALTALVAALSVTLLTACGGGGGGAATTATPAAASSPPGPTPLVAPGVWIVLGSSTAQGVGASPGAGWVARLATGNAARQVSLLNLSLAGSSTYAALPTASAHPANRPAADPARNVDRALTQQPSLVLLSFPTNDTAAGYGDQETVANLLAIRQAAAAGGAATVVLGAQPRNLFDSVQRQTLERIDLALSLQVGPCFVPLLAALADGQGQIAAAYAAGDGIHLNDAGHALVAQRVQAALDSGLCVRLQAG